MDWRQGILIGLMVGVAAPAEALPRVATYRGTIVSGTDATGVFTAPGTDLTGQGFIAQYFYDSTAGVRTTTPGVADVLNFSSSPSPTRDLIARLTINGHSFEFATSSGAAAVTIGAVFHFSKHFSDPGGPIATYALSNAVEAAIADPSLDADLTASDPSLRAGGFLIFNGFGQSADASGSFGNTTVTIGSAVPEPATWALMVGGFAMTGFAMRRRKVALAA